MNEIIYNDSLALLWRELVVGQIYRTSARWEDRWPQAIFRVIEPYHGDYASLVGMSPDGTVYGLGYFPVGNARAAGWTIGGGVLRRTTLAALSFGKWSEPAQSPPLFRVDGRDAYNVPEALIDRVRALDAADHRRARFGREGKSRKEMGPRPCRD